LINIRSEAEIDRIRVACSLVARTMETVRDLVEPGVTTLELSKKAQNFIESHGGEAAFLGYNGFPGAICVSLNEEVVHGIPSDKRTIEEGDLVKLDIGTYVDGFYGDMARSYYVGEIS
jgi:methionyl aminopeptidase